MAKTTSKAMEVKEVTKEVKEAKAATLTINVDKFITPIAIFLSSIIVASSIIFGLNNVANAYKAGGTTTTATTTDSTGTTAQPTVSKDSITALYSLSNGLKFGDSSRKVTFVEFSDPSCPFCHVAGGMDGPLNKQMGTNFVLTSDGGTYVAPVPEFKKLVDEGKASYLWFYTMGHGNGEMGAKALYCAQEQGKFWEAHDYLYSDAGYTLLNDTVQNDKTKSGTLADAMKSVVDSAKLKSCLDSGKYDSVISDDQAKGTELGVSGTPGFFINETSFPGAYSYTDMQATVESALNS